MRAAHLKANVAQLEMLGTERKARVLAAIDPAVIDAIHQATRLAWLPVDYDVAVSRAVVSVCGYDGAMQWSRAATEDTLRSPLLRNVVRPALRLFRSTPAGFLRLLPRMLSTIYRDCGTFEVHPAGPHSVRIEATNLPHVIHDDETYLHGLGETFAMACELVGVSPSATTERRSDGHVTWVLTW